MPRTLYTREFKIHAIAPLENGKKYVSQLAKDSKRIKKILLSMNLMGNPPLN